MKTGIMSEKPIKPGVRYNNAEPEVDKKKPLFL